MKKSLLGLILLFILFSTFNPKLDNKKNNNLNIKNIEIEGNYFLSDEEVKKKLTYLYDKNLFFINEKKLQNSLNQIGFIDSFHIKKVFPNKLRIKIIEKKPIAILQLKKKKFYISDKGKLFGFVMLEEYENLPTVFGNGKNFYSLYKNLEEIKFPINMVKSFYFFDSGRWDIIMYDEKTIKLPIKDYLSSLKNFMISKENSNFNNYKIFDYRIKDQLILN